MCSQLLLSRPDGRRQRLSTPLCPAGHLPRKGGDQQLRRRRCSCNGGDWRKRRRHPLSPLRGDGRQARGGVEDRQLSQLAGLTNPNGLS
ncbi:hypothetical protein FJ548_17585 [Mesorhizobium sp. B2-4-17]|nr:hypothetical protein FJ548_17585 [Mesorhizobium sp. B2-4-17]